MFTIEKNVPIPTGARKECPFPLAEMNVGDSFKLEVLERNTLRVWIQRYRSDNPDKSFITRKIVNEVRCWRIR